MEVPQATMEVPQATMKVQSCLWVWGFMPWAPLLGTAAAEPSPEPLASQIPVVGGNLKGPRGSRARNAQCQHG